MINHIHSFSYCFICIYFRKLNHPKLVRLYGVCSKLYPIYLVMEYMPNGSLLSYLQIHGKELQPLQLLEICYDVCDAMAFLESCQLIHKDLVSYPTREVKQERQRQFCPIVQVQLHWFSWCSPEKHHGLQSRDTWLAQHKALWARSFKATWKQHHLQANLSASKLG